MVSIGVTVSTGSGVAVAGVTGTEVRPILWVVCCLVMAM